MYDLKVPESFVPENADGEVESFELYPMEEVSARFGKMSISWWPGVNYVLQRTKNILEDSVYSAFNTIMCILSQYRFI